MCKGLSAYNEMILCIDYRDVKVVRGISYGR